jgi:hypothetical protein
MHVIIIIRVFHMRGYLIHIILIIYASNRPNLLFHIFSTGTRAYMGWVLRYCSAMLCKIQVKVFEYFYLDLVCQGLGDNYLLEYFLKLKFRIFPILIATIAIVIGTLVAVFKRSEIGFVRYCITRYYRII